MVCWFTVTDKKASSYYGSGFSLLMQTACEFAKIYLYYSMSKPYNKPDLTAPRFRPKRINLLNVDLYNDFIQKYPKYSHVTLAQFKKIISIFNEEMYKGVINNRDGVELPESLGFIFMGTCQSTKTKTIDVIKSMELGIQVAHQNWDSDNKLMKIFYTNHTSKYPWSNKQVWAFKAVKKFRQAASAAYKKDWSKYVSVDSTRKISATFARQRKKDYVVQQLAIVPEGYNEFNL